MTYMDQYSDSLRFTIRNLLGYRLLAIWYFKIVSRYYPTELYLFRFIRLDYTILFFIRLEIINRIENMWPNMMLLGLVWPM